MKDRRSEHGAYVRKVQEEMQTFAQDVLGEMQRLQGLVATLQQQVARQQGLLEGVRAETAGYSSRYAEIERQNSNLANLYVASYRLHGTLDRSEVVAAIQEIMANLVGSEEAALFEVEPDTQLLELVASFGVDADKWRAVPMGQGLIGRAARTGEVFVAGEDEGAPEGDETGLTACVPLKLDGHVMGVVAIFALLPQKVAIEELDRELFDLLATQAAFALYSTSLHAKVALEVARRW